MPPTNYDGQLLKYSNFIIKETNSIVAVFYLSTLSENAYQYQLKHWERDLRYLARFALKDDLQQLEALGIVVAA